MKIEKTDKGTFIITNDEANTIYLGGDAILGIPLHPGESVEALNTPTPSSDEVPATDPDASSID